MQQKMNSFFDGIYGPDVSDWLRGHKEALAYLGIIDCRRLYTINLFQLREKPGCTQL